MKAWVLLLSLLSACDTTQERLDQGKRIAFERSKGNCLEQIRAQPLPEQSAQLRNLEYFLSFMGQGIPLTGPSMRK